MEVITSKARWFAVGLAVSVGLILALGFLSTTVTLFEWAWPYLDLNSSYRMTAKLWSFPILTLLFYITVPKLDEDSGPKVKQSILISICILPWAIAGIFGQVLNPVPILDMDLLWWQILIAPVGEEFLFRGWLYGFLEKSWPRRMFSATNPMPVALWGSSIAFSLWHLQNRWPEPTASLGFTLFQVAYTLVAGVWLGFLRWKTGKLSLSILAHVVLNMMGAAAWRYFF